jgi:hypothetical protein
VAGALIITIIPIMLIVTVLLLVSTELSPVAAVGFATLLALVGVVFVGLLRAALRMQPSEAREEEEAAAEEEAELEAELGRRDVEFGTSRPGRDPEADRARARWSDDGGSPRP